MARKSPTQRTLELLRKEGWVAEVTEKWVPGFARGQQKESAEGKPYNMGHRKDLFGWVDVAAFKPGVGRILGIQATSGSNVAARVEKVRAWPYLADYLLCNDAEVWGWRKLANGRWEVRKVSLSAPSAASSEAGEARTEPGSAAR